MPYMFISTHIRLECGPTIVGDSESDKALMEFLEAKLIQQLGNNFSEYRTELLPRVVLNRLETRGFRVISMTGVGQTVSWTLHSETD